MNFDFKQYVTVEKYYEPVIEDCEPEYFREKFYKQYGLECLYCERASAQLILSQIGTGIETMKIDRGRCRK